MRELCRQKGIELLKGHVKPDHIHMLLSVPPKYAITLAIGNLKRRNAVWSHRVLLRIQGTGFGRTFWSRGYCLSTVGLDDTMISQYIQDQEQHERDQERNVFD